MSRGGPGSGAAAWVGRGGAPLRHQQLAPAANHTLTMDFHASSLVADRKRVVILDPHPAQQASIPLGRGRSMATTRIQFGQQGAQY